LFLTRRQEFKNDPVFLPQVSFKKLLMFPLRFEFRSCFFVLLSPNVHYLLVLLLCLSGELGYYYSEYDML